MSGIKAQRAFLGVQLLMAVALMVFTAYELFDVNENIESLLVFLAPVIIALFMILVRRRTISIFLEVMIAITWLVVTYYYGFTVDFVTMAMALYFLLAIIGIVVYAVTKENKKRL